MVAAIKEQKVYVDRHSSRVWFGDNVAKDIWKYIFTYGPMENMTKKRAGHICYGAHLLDCIENLRHGGD